MRKFTVKPKILASSRIIEAGSEYAYRGYLDYILRQLGLHKSSGRNITEVTDLGEITYTIKPKNITSGRGRYFLDLFVNRSVDNDIEAILESAIEDLGLEHVYVKRSRHESYTYFKVEDIPAYQIVK